MVRPDSATRMLVEVITDFGAYGEWNPFVVGCSSTLEVGTPIDMRVYVFAAFAQVMTLI